MREALHKIGELLRKETSESLTDRIQNWTPLNGLLRIPETIQAANFTEEELASIKKAGDNIWESINVPDTSTEQQLIYSIACLDIASNLFSFVLETSMHQDDVNV